MQSGLSASLARHARGVARERLAPNDAGTRFSGRRNLVRKSDAKRIDAAAAPLFVSPHAVALCAHQSIERFVDCAFSAANGEGGYGRRCSMFRHRRKAYIDL